MGTIVLTGATSGSTTIQPTDAVTVTCTLPSTGGTLQTSGSGYTANGVAYASSTSALATGSGLQFDGANLGLGNTPSATSATGYRALELGTNAGTGVTAQNGDLYINENAYVNGGAWKYAASSVASAQYNISSGAHKWNTAVSGTAGGTISWTSAMTLDTSGNLLVGTTSQSDSARFTLAYSTGVNNGMSFVGNASSAQNACIFRNTNGQVGSIVTSGSTTTYNITSDQRLKTNIVDAPEGNIDQIKIRSFDWKSDGTHNIYGVIAQELKEVAPYAVYEPVDTEQMMSVDYSKLVPMMIKEIQSLKAKVQALETK